MLLVQTSRAKRTRKEMTIMVIMLVLSVLLGFGMFTMHWHIAPPKKDS